MLVKGQDDGCSTVLKRIAALNGKAYPDVQVAIPTIKGREKVLALFRPRYGRIGAFISLNWLVVGMVYYQIFLSLGHYGNVTDTVEEFIKTNYLIAAAVEIPAAFISACLLCNVLGRRLAYIVNIVIFVVFTAISILKYDIHGNWDIQRVAILIGSKLAITGAKLILSLWTVELAPTTIRTLFFGLCLGFTATGVMVASGFAFFSLPPLYNVIIVCSLAVLSILGSTQIKDTSKWDLPNNLLDVYRNINLDESVYSDLPSEQATAL